MPDKSVHIQYYATLREQRGTSEETISTSSTTPEELYEELQVRYGFDLLPESLRVAVNDRFSTWDTALDEGDTVVFIPPVSGG